MFRVVTLLCVALLFGGCASDKKLKPELRAAKPQDFSGHWEVDYARSETVQSQFNTLVRKLQQDMARRAKASGERGAGIMINGGSGSAQSIYGLAQMAELITEPSLLTIEQTESEIRIERENSFALVCDLTRPQPVINETPFGTESCGWDGHQLLFSILLPEGLFVQHRMTKSAAYDLIVVATTVDSAEVSQPFTISKVFGRYDPSAVGFHCKDTLSKGRVCTTERPAEK